MSNWFILQAGSRNMKNDGTAACKMRGTKWMKNNRQSSYITELPE